MTEFELKSLENDDMEPEPRENEVAPREQPELESVSLKPESLGPSPIDEMATEAEEPIENFAPNKTFKAKEPKGLTTLNRMAQPKPQVDESAFDFIPVEKTKREQMMESLNAADGYQSKRSILLVSLAIAVLLGIIATTLHLIDSPQDMPKPLRQIIKKTGKTKERGKASQRLYRDKIRKKVVPSATPKTKKK